MYFDAAERGGVFWPLQTLAKHDMTDRQFANPLKGTVSPLVRTVPGCALPRRPREIRSRIQVGNVVAISNYTNMMKKKKEKKKTQSASVCAMTTSACNYQQYDLTAERRQDAESQTDICRLLRLDFFMPLSSDLAPTPTSTSPHLLPPSLLLLSSCITAKHLLFETQNVWSSITSQTQSAGEIALSNQAPCCGGSAVSPVKSLFHRGL